MDFVRDFKHALPSIPSTSTHIMPLLVDIISGMDLTQTKIKEGFSTNTSTFVQQYVFVYIHALKIYLHLHCSL